MDRPAEDKARQGERRMALVILAAQPGAPPSPCPPPEAFAALTEGRLDQGQRTALLEHLDNCSHCYREWLTLAAFQDTEDERQPVANHPLPRRFFSRPFYWASGLTLVLVVSLVVWWWQNFQLMEATDAVTEAYQMVYRQGALPGESELLEALILPWEQPDVAYGLGEIPRTALSHRAFGAGLWAGREMLTKRHNAKPLPDFLAPPDGIDQAAGWLDTPWAVYFQLGRWSLLLRATCQWHPDMPPPFWALQERILVEFEQTLAGRIEDEATMIMPVLERLRTLLQGLPATTDAARHCQSLVRELKRYEASLAPVREGG